MERQYNTAVFIGRFQPIHLGHLSVISQALKIADRLIIVVGSSYQPRSIKNPWTFDEREQMILSALRPTFEQDADRVVVLPVTDYAYNDQRWATHVTGLVASNTSSQNGRTAIIGHSKDESSYYLKMFPQWDLVEQPLVEHIDATKLRDCYLEGWKALVRGAVHPSTSEYMARFETEHPDVISDLRQEHAFINNYKKSWAAAPYPPTFVTSDAVVIQSGHILLIKRRACPGKGLWALPGGFVDQKETIQQSVIRELREETRIKVPAPVLIGSIKSQRVFDQPSRSLRGRTITHAFLIELPAGQLPQVKGGDDAAHAKWIPISDVRSDVMFEDHFSIIDEMVGTIN